jgi:hypothetical protein
VTASTLSIAIVTDGPILAWQAAVLDAIDATDRVTIARWDRMLPGLTTDRDLGGTGPLAVVTVPARLSDIRDRTDVTVDVALDLRLGSDLGPVDDAIESWFFTFGDTMSRTPERVARIAYIQDRPMRVALVAAPGDLVLREGLLAWQRGSQLDRLLLDTASWPAGAMIDRLDGIDDPATSSGDASRAPGADGVPAPILRVAALGRRLWNVPRAVLEHDDWNVGVIDAPIESVVRARAELPIAWLPLRPGRFAADPFGVHVDGTLHVFFEDYDQREGRGTIAHVCMGSDGSWTEPETVLDVGVHASYPYLIEDQGETFMLPETSAARESVLYRATDWPHGWQPVATLLTGFPAVDASVTRVGDRWWMFATSADRGPTHNLFIWHAPALTGPWEPHALNPVKTDARSARPGGTPFSVDGVLYRPSQHCVGGYGAQLTICRVDTLTSRAFSETPVATLPPPPGSPQPDGFHTLSAAGPRTLVDGKRRHLVPGALQRSIERRARPVTRRMVRG